MVGIAFMAAGADTVTGRVVGPGSTPLAGVRVALPKLNVSDTTGADGLFELKVPGTGLLAEQGAQTPRLTFGAEGMEGNLSGRDLLGKSTARSAAFNRVIVTNGSMRTRAGNGSFSQAMALSKAAADGDTLSLSKTGWFAKKMPMPSMAAQNMGDVLMLRNIVGVGSANYDKYDQFIVESYPKYGLDSSMAMVIKAMIVIESSFNAQAISMYDTQLPCGTHSYGLIQVTPGCEKGYATLPAGTKVTATISGGLNTVPATLTYADPADKTSGNTIVQENGIIIDLVTNPANPLWGTSAFNPSYSIANGAKALANVLVKVKVASAGCTQSEYVALALGSYNQGLDQNNKACISSNANGKAYASKVLDQYRNFCKSAGVTPVY
ncbi:MAG: peptidoglycan-binding lysin protein [Fibrobacteres bacterium]|nr:peptidoglycan-binding lysin protein [Fibrobacterota bacterium]